ncbi:MAG: lactate utilization protein C, partial [Acidobacteriota bacterium]
MADVAETMKERARAVQSIVLEAGDLDEAFRYAVSVTKERGGDSVAAPGLEGEERRALEKLCREAGLSLLTENLRGQSIHTGFTLADWGIAETGTLVIDSTPEGVRLATMLSEIHVAALPRSRIRPDASSLEMELKERMRSGGYLAFISGASRTADIERVLTIGVHGPGEL